MAVERAIFGFPSRTDKFTYSLGVWNASYPQSNLAVLPLSRVARTNDAGLSSTIILATATVPQRVGLVALPGHNLTVAAKIRLRCWGEAAMTNLVLDTGWVDVWPEVYPYDTLEWEDDAYWTGKYLADELANAVWTWFYLIGPGQMVGAIKIEIDDTSNAAGFVQFGYLEIAAQFQVSVNFAWGTQYGFRWRSPEQEALGGAIYVDRQPKPRVIQGSFDFSPRDEAMAKHFEIERQHDRDRPILYVPLPNETLHLLRTVMFARQLDPGLSAMSSFQTDKVPFKFEELIG